MCFNVQLRSGLNISSASTYLGTDVKEEGGYKIRSGERRPRGGGVGEFRGS